jgi:hypothetical protein
MQLRSWALKDHSVRQDKGQKCEVGAVLVQTYGEWSPSPVIVVPTLKSDQDEDDRYAIRKLGGPSARPGRQGQEREAPKGITQPAQAVAATSQRLMAGKEGWRYGTAGRMAVPLPAASRNFQPSPAASRPLARRAEASVSAPMDQSRYDVSLRRPTELRPSQIM